MGSRSAILASHFAEVLPFTVPSRQTDSLQIGTLGASGSRQTSGCPGRHVCPAEHHERMAEVDPDDDDILRYVVRHYRYDPQRHERRHVVVAAFDNDAEFRSRIEALGTDLRRREENGEADPREWISGVVLEPGYRRNQREDRWAGKRRLSRAAGFDTPLNPDGA
jgi:hypothetical protein